MPSFEILATAAIGVMGVFISFLTVRVNKPKIQAEANATTVTTSLALVAALEARVTRLEQEMRELHQGIELLVLQVRELGDDPIWRP